MMKRLNMKRQYIIVMALSMLLTSCTMLNDSNTEKHNDQNTDHTTVFTEAGSEVSEYIFNGTKSLETVTETEQHDFESETSLAVTEKTEKSDNEYITETISDVSRTETMTDAITEQTIIPEQPFSENDIIFTANDIKFGDTSVNWHIYNLHSYVYLSYGPDEARLEKLEDGEWVRQYKKDSWALAYSSRIEPESHTSGTESLSEYENEVLPGRYRLVISFIPHNLDRNEGIGEKFTLYAEFSVTE